MRLSDPTISSTIESTTGIEPDSFFSNVTFANVLNVDPLSQTLVYQSAYLSAPEWGPNQTLFSSFLNNVKTNITYPYPDGFFLQSGLFFWPYSGGQVVWTDDNILWLAPQGFAVDYHEHDIYYTAIYHYIADPERYWWLSAQDMTTGQYDIHLEDNARGTRIKFDMDTNVSFENHNTNADWFQGFSNSVSASYCYDSVNPYQGYKYWDSDVIVIIDSHSEIQPNNGVITGDLAHGGTATWYLDKILVVQ